VRRKWLILPLGAALATLAVVAFLAWLAAEDARQAALLEAREREAKDRMEQALARDRRLRGEGAPTEEVLRADWEAGEAWEELLTLRDEQARRKQSWPARLRQEVRRRTGW
jgi:hypothetical protein